MRSLLIAAAIFAGAAPALAQGQPQPAQAAPSELTARLDAHFRRYMEQAHAPGLIYGIVRDGRLVHVSNMGVQELEARRPVGPDSLFRIASMSKAFTALAILKLRDEGRLSLDALAETYVPEMRNWRYPTSDSPRIRVRDLLAHVGGFVTDDPWGDRQTPLPEAEFTRMLAAGVPFTRAPQTGFEYSNLGYALLGRIVTNVSGRPYADHIRDEIMRPLGMDSTGYDVAASPQARRALGYRWENEAHVREAEMAHGAFGAMGGVETSARDYARWVAFLLAAWPARDGAEQGPVRRSTVREMAQGLNFVNVRPRAGLDGAASCQVAAAYAMGFTVSRDCDLGTTLTHGGGYPGYGSFLLLMPEHNIGIFAFANRTYAGPSSAVFQAALELDRAGWLVSRGTPVSAALAESYRTAIAMYRAGDIAPGRSRLAMNFLMDRSEENWRGVFRLIGQSVGECATDAPITATGALSGSFAWTCARGRIEGSLLLAPTNPPTIQALRLGAIPAQ